MTIDEAIAHAREVARVNRLRVKHPVIHRNDEDKIEACILCAEEHEQLADWLEELKDYRDKNKMVVRIDVENIDSVKDKIEELSKYAESQYNKAIDDLLGGMNQITYNCQDADELFEKICDLAEQLKAGGENE